MSLGLLRWPLHPAPSICLTHSLPCVTILSKKLVHLRLGVVHAGSGMAALGILAHRKVPPTAITVCRGALRTD